MTTPVCPQCRADLEEDLVASTGRSECPFCGADVSHVEFPPEENYELPSESLDDEPAAMESHVARQTLPSEDLTDEEDVDELDDDVELPPVALGVDRPLPEKSRIEIIESSDDRRVFFLPGGSQGTGGLGCFALMWNGFMVVFTTAMAAGFKQQGNDAPLILIFLFVGLFWAVGLGMVYFWLRMRFTRTFVHLDREQLVVQKVLFGRKKITQTTFGPESKAELVVAYEQNDVPVHSVAVRGVDRTEKFGTALTEIEKQWFVDSINGFLGAAGIRGACEELLQKSGGEVVAAFSPADLPETGDITLEESTPEHLRFHLPLIPPGGIRKMMGCAGAAFLVTTVIPHAAVFFLKADIGILMHAAMLAVPMVVLYGFLFAWRGRITVDITRENFVARWHWGRYGMRKTLANSAINRISIVRHETHKSSRSSLQPDESRVCEVRAGNETAPLTTMHDVETARRVGGLVRYQLERMGFQVEDA